LPQFGSQLVRPVVSADGATQFVWRNKMTDAYKIGNEFQDVPLDLTNYLLLRTRERLVLQNKLQQRINTGGFLARFTRDLTDYSLTAVERDLEQGLQHLQKAFYIDNKEYNQPVAFATNALYLLARNGLIENEGALVEQLLTIVKDKSDFLHAEGVAQVAFALSEAQVWDEQIWGLLKEKIE